MGLSVFLLSFSGINQLLQILFKRPGERDEGQLGLPVNIANEYHSPSDEVSAHASLKHLQRASTNIAGIESKEKKRLMKTSVTGSAEDTLYNGSGVRGLSTGNVPGVRRNYVGELRLHPLLR